MASNRSLLILFCIFVTLTYISSYNLARSHIGSTLTMKGKGRRVPINQRGEYVKRKKMMEAKNSMENNKPEGVPVFKLYVRPKSGGLWVPCGDLAGDERATSLVNAWMSGFMEDMYKSQLDKGVARSLFNQGDTFVESLIQNYKPFSKFKKDDLEFGYKVDFDGLEEKKGEQKMTLLYKGMERGWIDDVREGLGGIFGGK